MITIPDNWPDYVVGLYSITTEAKKALSVLVNLPKERIDIFHAAMSGRSWMYSAQVANTKYPCDRGDYWRSVIEAVDIARGTRNPIEEMSWFLAPIPNTKTQWSAPTVLAERMEVV